MPSFSAQADKTQTKSYSFLKFFLKKCGTTIGIVQD